MHVAEPWSWVNSNQRSWHRCFPGAQRKQYPSWTRTVVGPSRPGVGVGKEHRLEVQHKKGCIPPCVTRLRCLCGRSGSGTAEEPVEALRFGERSMPQLRTRLARNPLRCLCHQDRSRVSGIGTRHRTCRIVGRVIFVHSFVQWHVFVSMHFILYNDSDM